MLFYILLIIILIIPVIFFIYNKENFDSSNDEAPSACLELIGENENENMRNLKRTMCYMGMNNNIRNNTGLSILNRLNYIDDDINNLVIIEENINNTSNRIDDLDIGITELENSLPTLEGNVRALQNRISNSSNEITNMSDNLNNALIDIYSNNNKIITFEESLDNSRFRNMPGFINAFDKSICALGRHYYNTPCYQPPGIRRGETICTTQASSNC